MQDCGYGLPRILLLRLYEKWFEQRLKRGSGRYTESRWVQKVAFWSSRDHVTVVSETFHTVSLLGTWVNRNFSTLFISAMVSARDVQVVYKFGHAPVVLL
jgi:hypothetical protein